MEQAALGEVPRERLSPAERARVAELREQDAEILRQYPAPRVAAEVRRRARGPRSERAVWMWAAAAPAIAAAAVFVALPESEDGASMVEVTRLKGDVLRIYRQTPSGPKPLVDGDQALEGDRLQLVLHLDRTAYVGVVSLDGRGAFTWHLPESPSARVARVPAGVTRLDHSYELDDAPRFERFFAVVSEAPFNAGGVGELLRGRGEAAGLERLSIQELTLRKAGR